MSTDLNTPEIETLARYLDGYRRVVVWKLERDDCGRHRLLRGGVRGEPPGLAGIDGPDQLCRVDNDEVSVRRILIHMLEETARHAGHADIIRELIDGTTGVFPEG